MSENHHPSPYSQEQDAYVANNPIPYIASPSQSPAASQQEYTQPQLHATLPPTTFTNIDELAIAYQLGHVQKILKNEVSKTLTYGLSSLLVGILFFLPLLLYELNYGGYLSTFRWTFLMGIAFLAYGINRTTIALNNFTTNMFRLNARYYLCRHGLLRIQGKQAQGLRWNEVSAIQKILSTDGHTPHQYILYPPNAQEPFVLENIGSTFKTLGLQIEQDIAQHLLPTSIAAYTSGQTLDLGAIDITPLGLYLKEEEKNLAWEDVGITNIQKDTLIINHKQTLEIWASIDTSTLLNLCILLPLVKYIKSTSTTASNQKPLSYQPPLNTQVQLSEWGEYE